MKKILHIISSPRGAASLSIQLGNAIIKQLIGKYPGSIVHENNLVNEQFPHLEEAQIASFFTPAQSRTPENILAAKHSDDAIDEIREADIIVIGAPVYNFGIPSALKAWIDHIVRSGVTFKYDQNGAAGLINGKKIYIAMASGGIYSDGPMKPFDFVEPYLKHIFSFIGISDITVFRVEGSAIPGVQDTALEKGISSIHLN
ncbi:FMN-dependent NADH-azoreductase [Mucilaginibacter ginsenosidivorax]|uniref:FMN dependent NADH:quinone oxidoreductase n=1 Tax=Mucilaginibacter ginsenosidivorax TaxID=862126 RepID=A0A5B8W5J9_9SPHI|nr:NAD(P)H-dependent oxidoreductase [Mucilaginibacter ginsenosidivorax]QEC77518.1 FMN-dependent NADH-azoreductase [Mucilaginibacter ginsenosidivorax]